MTITDPAHVAAAKALRVAFQRRCPGSRTAIRWPRGWTYDRAFGVDFTAEGVA